MRVNVILDTEKLAGLVSKDISDLDHWISGHLGELDGLVHKAVAGHLRGYGTDTGATEATEAGETTEAAGEGAPAV